MFFGVKGTRTHEKAILKLPPESKDPKGRFQDTTGTNSYTILGVIFHSCSYFWGSWGVSGTGLEKDAEKVRNETLQNVENGVPVFDGSTVFIFAAPPRSSAVLVDLWLHWESFGDALLRFTVFCCGCFFLDRIYE